MMKEMVPFIGPDYLTYDSDVFRPKWYAGQVAMANMWGSSAALVLPEQSPSPETAKDTRLAAAQNSARRSCFSTVISFFVAATMVSSSPALRPSLSTSAFGSLTARLLPYFETCIRTS